MIEREKYDFALFQEAIPYFIELLCRRPFLLDFYNISDLSGRTVNPYGVLTLARKGLNPSFHFHDLPTRMSRRLLVTEFHLGQHKVSIGNVHLESLNNQPTRERQLGIISSILSQEASKVVCGDFK